MTDRPHDSAAPNRDDETTEQLARDLHEQVRRLNHATAGAPGLTRPFTVYTILGDLSAAAHDLGQTLGQLGAFLAREHRAGRLGHDRGEDLRPLIEQAARLLKDAQAHTGGLTTTLNVCQTTINAIHGPIPTAADHPPTENPHELLKQATGGVLDAPDIRAGQNPPASHPGKGGHA
jgi:hypothetical protein